MAYSLERLGGPGKDQLTSAIELQNGSILAAGTFAGDLGIAELSPIGVLIRTPTLGTVSAGEAAPTLRRTANGLLVDGVTIGGTDTKKEVFLVKLTSDGSSVA